MPAIALFGLGIAAKSPVVTAKLMTNFYAETRPAGEKSMLVAYGTPGLELFCDVLAIARGALEFEKNSTAFVVAGDTLWEIDANGVKTNRGTLLTSSGRVSMAHNGVQIMIVDGFNGYIYNTVTIVFAQITDTDFPAGPQTVCYLSRRFVINVLDSSRFYVSDIDDGLSWDALNFANAESNPDPIIAVWASTGQLVLLGANTTEFWGNSGTLDFPFTALQGSANEWGMDAVASIAKYDNSFAWLVRNRMGQVMVAQMNGYLPKKISTIDIDHIINAYFATADAVAYSYMLGGHPFYVVSFPSVSPAAPAAQGSDAAAPVALAAGATPRAVTIVGTFETVYIAPDANPNDVWFRPLVFIENQNEFWIFVDDGTDIYVRRLDADDLSVKGTITLAGDAPTFAVYCALTNKVWGVVNDELVRIDTVSLAEDLRVTYPANLEEQDPITVNPIDGTPWVASGFDGSGDTFVYKVDPADGTIAETYPFRTAFDDPAKNVITDNAGNCWFLGYSNELFRADVASPGTVTIPYSDGAAFEFEQITYDAARNSIWISLPLEDPDPTPTGDLTWEFRRYDIALDTIDLVIGPPPDLVELYAMFKFDNQHDFLWREQMYTSQLLIGYDGADGQEVNAGTQTEPAAYGFDNYCFVTNAPGNRVYYLATVSSVKHIVKYSWPDPDPGPDPDPDPNPDDDGGGGIGGGPVNESWLYDGSTGFWSKLKSFGIDRHRVQFSYQLAGQTIGADYANGKQYRITDTALSDNGEAIEGEIVSETLTMGPDESFLTINKLRVGMEVGVGNTVAPGDNPQVSLSIARDSGAKQYGPEMWRPLGMTGEFFTRLEWRRLGTTRFFTAKLKITDPVKRVITGASVNPID